MLPRIWPTWVAVSMLLAATGCKGLFPSKGAPEDPLFLTHTPIEAKAQAGPPIHLSYSHPTMPSYPQPLPELAAPGTPVNIPNSQPK